MELVFNISKCVAWAAGLESEDDWHLWQLGQKSFAEQLNLPALKSIPAMQRRRLSPFAKITLHCALEAAGEHCADVPSVFSSRHGDLHKTTQLIKDVVNKETLSPTHFGLSVHNAIAGLFSIYTGNKMPISAVASGESSFLAGLIDSVAKLKANNYPRLLYVYSDLAVPDCYQPYVDEKEQSIAIALLLEPVDHSNDSIECLPSQTNQSNVTEYFQLAPEPERLPAHVELNFQPVQFMKYFLAKDEQFLSSVNQQQWSITRYAP